MDAPRCRLCETRHYGLCPAFMVTAPKAKPADKPPGAPLPLANSTKMDDSLANTPDPLLAHAASTYKSRDPDKRRAYQRDLMRRRRASERAGNH